MEEEKEEQNQNEQKTFELGTKVRVGDKYYQYTQTTFGTKEWLYRDPKALKEDNIRLSDLDKYHGFTVEPDFFDYQRDVDGWLNLFKPLDYKPIEGQFPTIEKLFKHVFQEHLEYGYDRFSIILKYPKHQQPILVLVSSLQGTAKTTFLNFISMLFRGNSVVLNISEYAQQFNALYASKLCIGLDETLISDKSVKERLKKDSTSNKIQLRKMHTEHSTLPFYGKFTLCSNNEISFANIEEEDERFWIRKLKKIEDFDPNFEEKLAAEIPYFLYFLNHRELSVPVAQGRLWFTKEMLYTDALGDIVDNSKSDCAKDIEILFKDEFEKQNRDTIGATTTEIWGLLGKKYSMNTISTALKYELKMENNNKTYYDIDNHFKNGRAYIFKKYDKNFPF